MIHGFCSESCNSIDDSAFAEVSSLISTEEATMPFIGPARTAQELAESAQTTYDGLGHPGLPGVTTDALKVDPKAYVQNGQLAEDIKKVLCNSKGLEAR